MGIYDQEYVEFLNNYIYWEDRFHEVEVAISQRGEIIHNLQTLYNEWRDKYANMTMLTNYCLKDFLEKLKEFDQIMCLVNTPEEVYHFVKFLLRLSPSLKGSLLGSTFILLICLTYLYFVNPMYL